MFQKLADDVVHAGFCREYQRCVSRQGVALKIGLVAYKNLGRVTISLLERCEQRGSALCVGDALISLVFQQRQQPAGISAVCRKP